VGAKEPDMVKRTVLAEISSSAALFMGGNKREAVTFGCLRARILTTWFVLLFELTCTLQSIMKHMFALERFRLLFFYPFMNKGYPQSLLTAT